MVSRFRRGSSDEERLRLKQIGMIFEPETGLFSCKIITDSGMFASEQMLQVVKISQEYGNGMLACTEDESILIQGIAKDHTNEVLACLKEYDIRTGGTGRRVRPVVSCEEGICDYGIYDVKKLGEKFQALFYHRMSEEALPEKLEIALDGCPNNCSASTQYDIGIHGVRVPVFNMRSCMGCMRCTVLESCSKGAISRDAHGIVVNEQKCSRCGDCVKVCPYGTTSESTAGYRVYVGGRRGEKNMIGRKLSRIFTTEESLFSVVDRIIFFYQEEGRKGERLFETIERIGFREMERRVLA
ncbi:Dissimilatory sulfite reductase (desulfoviridin), alpha and beta subunits [Lachnospiraceae bacterium XBB1006]|nr:Dissimilatory sulfite reductase (desulfoviridin), alpha and beta subunits [Lachnospiraceae bacterium XBB1006]